MPATATLSAENMAVEDIIKEKIGRDGPIPFSDFMDMSLYYPGKGYYTSGETRIGRDGDYYTSSSFFPVFGILVARQMCEMWNCLGGGEFTVLEYGAGDARLCIDILEYLEKKHAAFYSSIRYHIIEKREPSEETLRKTEQHNIKWHQTAEGLNTFKGCILANELLDNFPFRRVMMDEDLQELVVDYQGQFSENKVPAHEDLSEYLGEMQVSLAKGCRAELNLGVKDWIEEASSLLIKGYLMTIDYGHTAHELYSPTRSDGTLMCYYKHSVSQNPFENIGRQDITSHVNFSALNKWGTSFGLECLGYTTQGLFMRSMGLAAVLREIEQEKSFKVAEPADKIKILNLIMPDNEGKFKVMIQARNTGSSKLLQGLQFSARRI